MFVFFGPMLGAIKVKKKDNLDNLTEDISRKSYPLTHNIS